VASSADQSLTESLTESQVESLTDDYRNADLTTRHRAMLDYAWKLTRTPAAMSERDVEVLRAAGFDDAAIHDVAQVTSYFNYINRIADGLGVEPEPEP